MTIPVYDFRTDIGNVIVRPEIRSRFMRMEPGPASPLHSHDLGGEIFLVVDGLCEFIVEDEKVTCGAGQLVYMEPRVKHTLHAVGDGPCVVYLSVTPHVEPTHTRYDEELNTLPPVYGGWRGKDYQDLTANQATADLAQTYTESARKLAELATKTATDLEHLTKQLVTNTDAQDVQSTKQTMDDMWLGLRDVLLQVSEVEGSWNDLAPRGMPTEKSS